MLQRLDIRSARFDRLSGVVAFDARDCVVEVSMAALESLAQRPVRPEEAVQVAVEAARLISRLASRLPADDGKIHITHKILANGAMFGEDREN